MYIAKYIKYKLNLNLRKKILPLIFYLTFNNLRLTFPKTGSQQFLTVRIY